MRIAFLVSLDIADDDNYEAHPLRFTVEKLREALGQELPEHRPLVTLTIDPRDIERVTAIETEISERMQWPSLAERMRNADWIDETELAP